MEYVCDINTIFPNSSKNEPPLVWGYRWDAQTVLRSKSERKLLRASVAIPGGSYPQECNLKCIFCFTEGGKRNRFKPEVSNEEVISFLQDASNYALSPEDMIYFFVSEGEPLLNKGLSNVIKETSKLGGKMTIFTNLTHLSNEHLELFIRTKNLFICGKMYGINENTSDYLTGASGSYRKMMKNINKLIDSGLAEEGRLGVQCVVTSKNKDEILDIFKWGRQNKVIPHIMMYREQGLGVNFPDLAIHAQDLINVYKSCSDWDKENYGYIWNPMPPMLGMDTCYIQGINIYMVRNGDIHLCAGNTTVVGNYKNQPLSEIMKNETLNEVMEHFVECPWIETLRETGELVKKCSC